MEWIFDQVQEGLAIFDRDSRILFMNRSAIQEFGYCSENLVGQTFTSLCDGPNGRIFREKLSEALNGQLPVFELSVSRHDRSPVKLSLSLNSAVDWIWAVMRFKPQPTGDEAIRHIAEHRSRAFFDNFSENMILAERELHVLQTLIENLPDQVYIKDRQCRFVTTNRAHLEILGLDRPDEVLGRSDFDFFSSEQAGELFSDEQQVIHYGKPLVNKEGVCLNRSTGATIWTLTTKVPLRNSTGAIVGLIGINRDITERKKAEEQMKYLLFHDPVTQLYNRVFLEEEFRRLNTPRQFPIGVVMGSVNGLRLVNDVFGHQAGDRLLERIARTLKSVCREEDIIARWSGDEFIVLLPQTTSEQMPALIDRIRVALEEAEPNPVALSCSLGYAVKSRRKDDLTEVIRLAEERMGECKAIESRRARCSIIASLERSLREKTQETEAHIGRLKTLARRMGQFAGLSEQQLEELNLLARLHDVGHIAVSREILDKVETLSSQEWEAIRKHPEIGFRIARASSELAPIAEAILSHHERWDGQGYPQGLKAEEIPVLSRIIAILDAFDVMTGGRPYKLPLSYQEALQAMERESGYQFDPIFLDVFFKTIGQNR